MLSDCENVEIASTARKETITKTKVKSRGEIFATHNRYVGLKQLIHKKLSAVSQKKTDNLVGKLAKDINKQLTEKNILIADTYMKSNTCPHL